ncbi:reverse transcriptase zinc-binding domain-containing protein [Artemisia annua]|uniref:Reverse transcriptase zinc-binding domain-containing protein n=1 Tax=Artemisia annua TaxID=35608 RepID=A0A2U1KJ48_ARTAN|nr:reverse transcriptase zinc-binding domain-containing protein [Artemisia annua]
MSVVFNTLVGGLGLWIRRLRLWNIALMSTHIWSILSNRQSLWVKWIHSYHLQGRHFWDVPIKADVSNGWRKILQIYPLAIRPRGERVNWFDVVWFSQCIPRHAFLIWLLMGERLKTQDKLRTYDVDATATIKDIRCPLCELTQDNHSHLFFECSYSSHVWNKVKPLLFILSPDNAWKSFVGAIQPIAHKNSARCLEAGNYALVPSFVSFWFVAGRCDVVCSSHETISLSNGS